MGIAVDDSKGRGKATVYTLETIKKYLSLNFCHQIKFANTHGKTLNTQGRVVNTHGKTVNTHGELIAPLIFKYTTNLSKYTT